MTYFISVCIATFNGEQYVDEQLKSILPQLDENSEIIVSDDNSTDKTVEIIKKIKDSRIKIYNNEGKSGIVCNIENALKKAKGDFIFLADQDDIWHPNKVSLMMKDLHTYDLVVCDAIIIDNNKKIINDSFYEFNHSGRGFIKNIYRNSFIGCCMGFNKKILNYVLPFPDGIAIHDLWIGLNSILIGKYHFSKSPLIYYRRHENNVTSLLGKSSFTISYMMKYRLHILYQLIKRRLFR